MARELRSNFRIPENFECPAVLTRTSRKQRTMADPNADAAVVAVPVRTAVLDRKTAVRKRVKRWLDWV